ncbi:S-layer homology domain-containing protein [Virgibacillus sp. FSP13]
MSNKRNYRKLATSTMAAAAAVTAIAPVVSAAESTTEFSDVDKSNDHYEGIMALAEQGIIQGYTDGRFGPWDNVTRAQVAAMLSNALNLDAPADIDEVLKGYTDVNADNEYAEQIAAVTAENVFKGQLNNKFNPWNDISREQMATVLVKGLDLDKYDTGEKADVNLDNVTPDHADNVQVLADLGITVELDDFRPTEKISRAQFSTMLNKALNVVEENATPVVESVSAVTAGEVTVNFNKLPENLNADQFTIENSKNVEVPVKEIKASDDNSVVLVLDRDLENNGEYSLSYNNGEESKSYDFSYVKATPTSVEITTSTIAANDGAAAVEAKVLAGSTDVTSDFDVIFSDDNGYLNEDGSLKDELEKGTTFLAKAKVVSDDTTIESKPVLVTVESAVADDYNFFTIADSAVADSTLKEEDTVTTVETDYVSENAKYVVPYVNDQFGDLLENTDETFQFKSLNPDTVLVNENSGKILGVYKEGKAQIEITSPGTSFKQIVTLNVQKPAEVSSFELSDTEYSTVDTASAKTISVTVKDQYGKAVSGVTPEVTVADNSKDKVSVDNNIEATDKDGKTTFTIEPNAGESGKAVINVKAGELDVQTVTVDIEKAGQTVGYDITNTGDDLVYDKNDSKDDALAFSVYGVDANGNHTSKDSVDDVKYVVKDDEGNKVESNGLSYDVSKSELGVGKYTLEASKNGFSYGSVSFEIVDTTSHLATVDFQTTSIELTGDTNLVDALNGVKPVLKDQFGEVIKSDDDKNKQLDATDIDFENIVVTNEKVFDIDENKNINLKSSGTATLNVPFKVVDADGKETTKNVSFQVTTKIDTQDELEDAISHSTAATDTITLAGDIDLDSELDINNPVTINGDDAFTIDGSVLVTADNVTLKDLTVDGPNTVADHWDGDYAIQLYDVNDAKLTNVTAKNSDAGILVNGSTATFHNITTSDNEFGGIEVSKGTGVSQDPELTVTGTSKHNDAEGKPAIWIDGETSNNGWVSADAYEETTENDKTQVWFNLK